jgi:hypothetical protein
MEHGMFRPQNIGDFHAPRIAGNPKAESGNRESENATNLEPQITQRNADGKTQKRSAKIAKAECWANGAKDPVQPQIAQMNADGERASLRFPLFACIVCWIVGLLV